MVMSINHNQNAERSARELGLAGEEASKQSLRVSTGRRVVMASDDPSASAIESSMLVYTNSLGQASINARQAVQVTEIMDSSLQSIRDNLTKMDILADRAGNAFVSDADRRNINIEFREMLEEINRVSSSTRYGRKSLLYGDTTQNKSYISSKIEGIDNISFRTGIIDDFAITGTRNGGIRVTSMQDSTRTQAIEEAFRPGETLYFDQLGIYVKTNKDFSISSLRDVNQSLKGKRLEFTKYRPSMMEMQGIKQVRFNDDNGNNTYKVSAVGNDITLTNMFNGKSETMEYDGHNKTLHFDVMGARVDLSDDFHPNKVTNFVRKSSTNNLDKMDDGKSKITVITDEHEGFSAYDFKYDRKTFALTVTGIEGDRMYSTNINLASLKGGEAKVYDIDINGVNHRIGIDIGFNKNKDIHYSQGIVLEALEFESQEGAFNGAGISRMSIKSINGDISHLTGRMFFDNGVMGKRLVLESKTGDHMYSLNNATYKLGMPQRVQFQNQDGTATIESSITFSSLDVDAIDLKRAVGRMHGSTKDVEVFSVSHSNASGLSVMALEFGTDINLESKIAFANFVKNDGTKLEGRIKDAVIEINGVRKEGFIISHNSSTDNVSVFVLKDPDAITVKLKPQMARISLNNIFDFQTGLPHTNIGKAFNGMQFSSKKSDNLARVIANTFTRGAIKDVKFESSVGDLSSLDTSTLRIESLGNNKLIATMGGFTSDIFDYAFDGKAKDIALVDMSNNSNSINISLQVSQKIEGPSGFMDFDLSSIMDKLVGNKISREFSEHGSVNAAKYHSYKTDIKAHTYSASGIDALQVSNIGIRDILLTNSDRLTSTQSFEYSYDASKRELKISDINSSLDMRVYISDDMVRDLKSKGEVEARGEIGSYKVVVRLDSNFNVEKDIYGYSTDERNKTEKVGDSLTATAGRISTDAIIKDVRITKFQGASMHKMFNDKKLYIEYNANGQFIDEKGNEVQGPSYKLLVMSNHIKDGQVVENLADTVIAQSAEFSAADFGGKNKAIKIVGIGGDVTIDLDMTSAGDLTKLSSQADIPEKVFFEVSNSEKLFGSVIGFNKNITAEVMKSEDGSPRLDVGTFEIDAESAQNIDLYTRNMLNDAVQNSAIRLTDNLDGESVPQGFSLSEGGMIVKFGDFIGVVNDMPVAGKKVVNMKYNLTDAESVFQINFFNNGSSVRNPNNVPIADYSFSEVHGRNSIVQQNYDRSGAFDYVTILQASGRGTDTFDDSHAYFYGKTDSAKIVMFTNREANNNTLRFESTEEIDLTKAGVKKVTLKNVDTGGIVVLELKHDAIEKSSAEFMSYYNTKGHEEAFKIDLAKVLENTANMFRLRDISKNGGMLSEVMVEDVQGSLAGMEDTISIDINDISNAKFTVNKITGGEFSGVVDLSRIGNTKVDLRDEDGNGFSISGVVVSDFSNSDQNIIASIDNFQRSVIATYAAGDDKVARTIQEIDAAPAKFNISIGADFLDVTTIVVDKIDSKRLDVDTLEVSNVDLAVEARKAIRLALEKINDVRSSVGAFQAKLISAYKASDSIAERVRNAISDLVDLDAPTGYSKLLNDTIRMEGVSQMLAKSFSTPRLLSQLLRSLN